MGRPLLVKYYALAGLRELLFRCYKSQATLPLQRAGWHQHQIGLTTMYTVLLCTTRVLQLLAEILSNQTLQFRYKPRNTEFPFPACPLFLSLIHI